MAAYGRYNGYPRKYGGGKTTHQIQHEALLAALAPGYDPASDTANFAELYAYALAISMIWAVNGRLRNQQIPANMLEALPDWEEILKLRPEPTDTVQQRRARVAAKLRGLVNNALSDISDSCAALAGANFLGLATAAVSDIYAWWPGVNPGPPGFEWSSNRAAIAVRLQRSGLSDSDFFRLIERLYQNLEALVPTWLGFCVGTDDGGFICDVGVCDVTLL